MSRDVFNPDRANAERVAHMVTARRVFQQSGIVGVVDEVRGLLPEGTEIEIYDDTEKGTPPCVILTGPETDGVKIRFKWGDPGGENWCRLLPVHTSTRERMLLTVGILGVNSSILDFEVHKSIVEPSSKHPQPSVGLIWAGSVGDISEQDQLRRRLHYGLKRAFTFSSDQDRRLQQLLPPASPVRVASYSYGRLVEVR